MKTPKVLSALPISAFATALALIASAVGSQAADLGRVSINDDWRFIKGDPTNLTDNLAYPRVPRVGRGAVAPTNAISPTSGIAQFILPTGDAFIADPTKRYAKPAGNFGGDIPYVNPKFNDRSWRKLDLPHDFAIEGPFIPPTAAGSDGATGRLPFFGVAWYRKHLTIPESYIGRNIYLDIDGAMSYATVWCNGKIVGGWPYGYSSWRLDLTSYLRPGADNVLAIRLDNPPNSSRWYPGGGIYRNVWLTTTPPVHVGQWGTYITTPEVSTSSATVDIKVTVDIPMRQSAAVSVVNEIFEIDTNNVKTGSAVASVTTSNVTAEASRGVDASGAGSAVVESKIIVANPKLWSPNAPNRYVIVTTINGADKYETRFGIRTIKYDPAAGLFVNGEHFKLNGVCDHHDLGSLGTALNVRALQRQLEMLRAMGCNAIRTSHNPPAPELLDFADQMGFLVLDEAFDTWGQNKTRNDYGGGNLFNMWHEQDLRALIRRDRNHPSIVMWSIGNEIGEQNQGSNSVIAKELAGIVHSEDPTRPVTAACNDFNSMNNGFATLLDAMGFNYKPDNYIRFHELYPNEFFFATETASTISSRGEYYFPVTSDPFGIVNGRGRNGQSNGSQDDTNHQVSSYDLYHPGWATTADHEFFGQDHSPAVAGEFVWTGFDYIGEPTPWGNRADTSRSSYFGIIDLAGFPKDRYYLYQAHWRPDFPMAHILPHWNWPDRAADTNANPPKAAQITPVHVYTSGDEAELFLNGKSLGRKKKVFDAPNVSRVNGEPAYRIRWDDVAYEPGELKVVAYKNGKVWATDTVKTAGAAKKLELQPDRATIAGDGHDISFVTLRIADASGTLVPRSMNLIHFKVSGPGEIVSTDNGDATDLSSFQSPDRKAFNGMALVVVKAKRGQHGKITVTATADGLTKATTTIVVTK